MTIGIRGEGSTTGAPLSFQLDDIGITEAPAKPDQTDVHTPVGGTVPATLALTLGSPDVSFGAFTPGIAREYTTTLAVTSTSTAADAQLSVSDPSQTAPGHLVNGPFALSAPLQAAVGATPFAAISDRPLALVAYPGPVSNATETVALKQAISASEPLRTGNYGKTLTFTLSTTTP